MYKTFTRNFDIIYAIDTNVRKIQEYIAKVNPYYTLLFHNICYF